MFEPQEFYYIILYFVTRSKCEDEDDEAMAQEEIMEMFPSYSDEDFSEFKPSTLEQKPTKPKDTKPKYLISSEDVTLIYKWHANFVRTMTYAEWLVGPKKLVGNDVVSPLIKRYSTFSKVVEHAWEALDADFEGTVSPSLLVLLSHIKEKIDGTGEYYCYMNISVANSGDFPLNLGCLYLTASLI